MPSMQGGSARKQTKHESMHLIFVLENPEDMDKGASIVWLTLLLCCMESFWAMC